MKSVKIVWLAIFPFFLFACSEDKMDEINKERNQALEMGAQSIIPSIEVVSGFETAGTDIAWYATVYIEHSAGSWAQSYDADKRTGQTVGTLFNNNWNSIYDCLMVCNDVLKKTDPATGNEKDNKFARGIAQTLMAYNLATLTDMWGEIPWSEALKGAENLQPKYDKQSTIYPEIFKLLDDAIKNFSEATNISSVGDYIYKGSKDKWTKAAYSLKARYSLRLTNVDANAATKALDAASKGFVSAADGMLFSSYENTATGENPWFQFLSDRAHLSVGTTLYNLMLERHDTLRMAAYFTKIGGEYKPAPNGGSQQTQGGVYSNSKITADGKVAPTPIMTFHELKFIVAEAKFRKGDATWKDDLKAAVEANFVFHGLTAAQGTAYYNGSVARKLTPGNELNEILLQKYIGAYEFEATEAYNDYRRVPGFITLNNPNNTTVGFVWRFPYPTSEQSSNSANIPKVNVFTDKLWWAGGAEK